MKGTAELTPAFVLHSREYRETSSLVEFFTRSEGRVSSVVRGVRGAKKKGAGASAAIQPFVPLVASFTGRSELKTARAVETTGPPILQQGQRLFMGLYLNELLVRLLGKHDPHPLLYEGYVASLQELAADGAAEPILRIFELQLLMELGYGVVFDHEVLTGIEIDAMSAYRYKVEEGFVRSARGGFPGEDLLAIDRRDFSGASTRRTAKEILRVTIAHLLGGKSLKSRELFASGRGQT